MKDFNKTMQLARIADFMAIDFETARGADRETACAVGIVFVKDGEIIGETSSLIRPPDNKFDNFNIELSGITPEMTENSPLLSHLWEHEGMNIIAEELCPFVAHNAAFDRTVLYYSLKYYNLPLPFLDSVCTVELARKTFPHLENHKLPTVSKHLNIPLNHHDPLSDARACAKIMLLAGQEIIQEQRKDLAWREQEEVCREIELLIQKAKDHEKTSPGKSANLYFDAIKRIFEMHKKYGENSYAPRMPVNRFSLLLERNKKFSEAKKVIDWYLKYEETAPEKQTQADYDSIIKRKKRMESKINK